MATNDIFRVIRTLDSSTGSSTPYFMKREKQEQKPSKNPFANPVMPTIKDIPGNKLFDVPIKEEPKAFNLFDFLVSMILNLLGKKKQWEDAKTQLSALENRVNEIETAIKGYETFNKANSYKI